MRTPVIFGETSVLNPHMCLLASVLLSSTSPIVARDSPWPVRYWHDVRRMTNIQWRLRQVAENTCPVQAADIGIALDDRRAYQPRDWPLIGQTLGLYERPIVAAIAEGGPAMLAGLLPGDEVETIAGEDVEVIAERRKAGKLVAEELIEEISQKSPGKPFNVGVKRANLSMSIEVVPVKHCAVRLVLVSNNSVDAHSDSHNVAISTGLVAFSQTDDELALAAGHELAHVIHRDRRGGGIAKRRELEDAADSLGLRLMRCAGYDANKGLLLFDRLGARDWLGFLRAPTHRSFKARAQRLRTELRNPACLAK